MSYCVKKTQCPKCSRMGKDNGKDNLAVYSDGHSFCFACGHIEHNIHARIQNIKTRNIIQLDRDIKLPSDCDINYPSKVIQYLNKFELLKDDLLEYNFLFSEKYNRLIYPIWDNEDRLIFWTGRYFGIDKKPKWLKYTAIDNYVHFINKDAKVIFIVEDIFSAIKIVKANKDYGALVLFNSHNPIDKIKNLKDKRFILWLDNDKFRESLMYIKEIKARYNLDIKTKVSERDPKDVSMNILKHEKY